MPTYAKSTTLVNPIIRTFPEIIPDKLRENTPRVPCEDTDPEKTKIQDILGSSRDHLEFIFDTETSTDTSQAFRVGFAEVRGLSMTELRRELDKRGAQGLAEWLDRDERPLSRVLRRYCFHAKDTPAHDLEVIHQFAREYNAAHWLRDDAPERMQVLTKGKFLIELFVWTHNFSARMVGHNLPFDISRIAEYWGQGKRDFQKGFSFRLCDCLENWQNKNPECAAPSTNHCLNHPGIRVVKLGPKKHKIEFTVAGSKNIQSNPQAKWPKTRGVFLDVGTLARALLGPIDASQANLCKLLGVALEKETVTHGDALTLEYLKYAYHDVIRTHECCVKLREMYRRHNLDKSIQYIFSEASLGKAYYEKIGIPKFRNKIQRHSDDTPPRVAEIEETLYYNGIGMAAYYGGWTQIGTRLKPVEVMATDFTSAYPSVYALLGNQDLLLAQSIQREHNPAWLMSFLQNLTIDTMQDQDVWKCLKTFVRIVPNGDRLPVRADFDGSGDGSNIGVQPIVFDKPMWYCLPDVVLSALSTGRIPTIVDSYELKPVDRIKTQPIDIIGDSDYRVDLETEDFFQRVIELRQEIKSLIKNHPEQRSYLDAVQNALKLVANSTSYGIMVEFTPMDKRDDKFSVRLHYGQDEQGAMPGLYQRNINNRQGIGLTMRHIWPHRISKAKEEPRLSIPTLFPASYDDIRPFDEPEKPGGYCFPELASLITSGTRLLLGLGELIGERENLHVANRDTDSLYFERPESMAADEFRAAVKRVCSWFDMLSPYRDGIPLLKVEDENYLDGGDSLKERPEPLYLLAVSSKRYCLFNKRWWVSESNEWRNEIRLRKCSTHGTGSYMAFFDYESPLHFDYAPGINDPVCKTPRWIIDMWMGIIPFVVQNHIPHNWNMEGAKHVLKFLEDWPAVHPETIATWEVYKHAYDYLPNARPFSFLVTLPSSGNSVGELIPACYASFSRDARTILDNRSVKGTHEPYTSSPVSLARALEWYFCNPESKAEAPFGVGHINPRWLMGEKLRLCGKETDRLYDEEPNADGSTIFTPPSMWVGDTEKPQADVIEGLYFKTPIKTMVDWVGGVAGTAKAMGVPLAWIQDALQNRPVPSNLLRAFNEFSWRWRKLGAEWNEPYDCPEGVYFDESLNLWMENGVPWRRPPHRDAGGNVSQLLQKLLTACKRKEILERCALTSGRYEQLRKGASASPEELRLIREAFESALFKKFNIQKALQALIDQGVSQRQIAGMVEPRLPPAHRKRRVTHKDVGRWLDGEKVDEWIKYAVMDALREIKA